MASICTYCGTELTTGGCPKWDCPSKSIRTASAPAGTPEEGTCERCLQPNPLSWFVASKHWNRVMRGGDCGAPDRFGFCCPTCFIELAREAGLDPAAWELRPKEPAPEPLMDARSVADRDWGERIAATYRRAE